MSIYKPTLLGLHSKIGASVRRLVGNRHDLPNSAGGVYNSANGVNSWNLRKLCYALTDIVDPSMAFAGFAYSTGAEINIPNVVTWDYLAFEVGGSLYPITGVTINPGDTFVESGRSVGLTIPAGTIFFLRGHGKVPVSTAGAFQYSYLYRDNANGECIEVGLDLAIRNTAGSFATQPQNMPSIAGVMGTVPAGQRAFATVGDSVSQGVGGYVEPTRRDYGIYNAIISKFGYSNLHFGRSGSGTFNNTGRYAKRAAFAQSAGITDILCNLGINDLDSSNRTAAQLLTDLNNLKAQLFGAAPALKRWYQATAMPATNKSGGAGNVTDANQTTPTNLVDGRRFTHNTNVRSLSISGQTGYVETSLPAENALDANWWKAGYSSDSTYAAHPNQTGGQAAVDAVVTNPFA